MMMDINNALSAVLAYNRELIEGLSEMYNLLPPGQKKQVLKNEKVKACLVRFGIIEED